MIEQRSDEDVLRGVLVASIGRTKKELPVLAIADSRKWKVELGRVLGGEIAGMKLDGIEDGSAIALAVGDRTLDLVLSYDVDAALGGREWVEANATDEEVYHLLRRLIEVTFPFVRDLRSLVAELRALGLADLVASARSLAPSSTNGPSPNGDSVPLVSSGS